MTSQQMIFAIQDLIEKKRKQMRKLDIDINTLHSAIIMLRNGDVKPDSNSGIVGWVKKEMEGREETSNGLF